MRGWLPLAALALLTGCSEAVPYGATCTSVPAAWNEPEIGVVEWDAGREKIYLEKRDIYWNAIPVTRATLREYLGVVGKQPIRVPIILEIAPTADCRVVREVIAEMKRAAVCETHCGTYKRWPTAWQPPPPGY